MRQFTVKVVPRQYVRLRGYQSWIGVAISLAACSELPTEGQTRAALSRPATASAPDAERSITLITGDRVTLGASPGDIHITPGPGRASVGFITLRRGDEVTVIPKDVLPLVGSGRVDRALFAVTRLITDGYSDRDRDDLPLLVTGQAPAALAHASLATASADVTIDRAIPALAATALRQRKSSPGAVLAMVQSAAPAALAPAASTQPPKIWLDRVYKPVLDHSVPQIGAPAAWARGFTGAGVVVAVLDTGIDASHPDLAGKVIDAESFLDDGLGTSDVVGHATHVASIIAGTGAASSGQYRGVAPDAQLLSGRVCGNFGCFESAILAGMAWAAVEKHAPIVNLSLSGFDTPDLDPLEDAVNQLSAQYGTLFVIAAGNNGEFGNGTIGSPGSAEAALTVGAVDRDDQLAVFSSTGPNQGDHAIKPDVTAPGVDIVAAMASGVPPIGEPVGAFYQRLSGTSMATPHVAGAAAILLQQHPSWTGAELKAALIGSALPNPALTEFQQGAGRIDVDRATRQGVVGEPANLSLGLARWPHTDDPLLVRTVHYRNDADAPITLALTASLALADHTAAPAGMIQIAPAALTIPAGGSADATLTVDTNGDAPDSIYTGLVVATAGDVRIETLVEVEREVESYDLAMQFVDQAGNPAAPFVDLVTRRPTGSQFIFFPDGETTLRLPRDEYNLYDFDGPVYLAAPRVVLDRDVALDFDERLAQPVNFSVRGVDLEPRGVEAGALDPQDGVVAVNFSLRQLFTAQIGANAAEDFHSWILVSEVPQGSPDTDFPAIADPYTFAHVERGRMVTGWQQSLVPAQLTTVDARQFGASHSVLRRFLSPVLADAPEFGAVGDADAYDYPAMSQRTEHLYGPGVRWATAVAQFEPFPQFPDFRFSVAEWLTVPDYRLGQHYTERWHRAPFGPSLGQGPDGPPAARTGDTLTIAPSLFSDRSVPARQNWAISETQRRTLYRDGAVLVDDQDPLFTFWFPPLSVPPEAATYRYVQDETRGSSFDETLFELSTHVTAEWTFRSQHVAGSAPALLPLPTLRFLPELDDNDRASGRAMLLPVLIERPAGAATPRIARIHIEISFDDGATWSNVPGLAAPGSGGDHWLGLVIHPAHAAFASLRGTVEDIDGRRNEVTILRAYRVD